MFKKAKRANFRRRNDSEEDEPQEGVQPILAPTLFGPIAAQVPFLETSHNCSSIADSHPSNGFLGSLNTMKAIKKEKKVKEVVPVQVPTKASLLSFDDDEDESEVFRVKKPTHSKKIVKQLKREYKEDLEKTCVVKQEPRSDGVPVTTIKEEITSTVANVPVEEEMEVDSTEEQEDVKPQGGHAANQLSRSKNAGATFNTFSSLNALRPGEIPDAAFIHAARKRRQLARELGGDAPLVETEDTKKRMGQEDQDCSEDEDDEKRIRFSGVKNKSQRQKIAEEIGIEGSDDEALDTGQDEEVSRWEQEQIRKGISIPQVQSSQMDESTTYYQNTYETHPYGSSYSMPFAYSTIAAQSAKASGQAGNGSVQFGSTIGELTPVSIDLVKKRLQDR